VELVHICGSMGRKFENVEDTASYFLWRLLDLQDAGRLSRVDTLRRLEEIFTGSKVRPLNASPSRF
jgi:hypothetical protein